MRKNIVILKRLAPFWVKAFWLMFLAKLTPSSWHSVFYGYGKELEKMDKEVDLIKDFKCKN